VRDSTRDNQARNVQQVKGHTPINGELTDPTGIKSGMGATDDKVNHPAHYNFGKFEVIEVIEDWNLPYHLGNALKYIARAGRKDKTKTEEDLRKAAWYVKRYIEVLNGDAGKPNDKARA